MDYKTHMDTVVTIENNKERKRSGKFSPSGFGRCYRYQVWNRRDEEVSNPIDTATLLKFRVGNLFHRDIQGTLDKKFCEVKYEDSDFIGFCDHVGSDWVADFKTVGTFQWKKLNGKSYDVEVDNEQYCYQLMAYAYWFGKSKGYLVFINKDSYEVKQSKPILLNNWMGRVADEIEILDGYWKDGKLPPAYPRAYKQGGKSVECRYCVFKDKCERLEGVNGG